MKRGRCLRHHARRWLAGVLTLWGLAGNAMGSNYSPGDFFTGPYLEAAHSLDRGEFARIPDILRGLDIDAVGRKDMTLLWYAMQAKNYPGIQALVALGSKPDEQIAQGIGSALHAAFMSKETDYLKAMLDGGLSPNHQHPKQELMLQRAIVYGSSAHLKLLVERGADVNAHDSIGGNALHHAVNTMHPEQAAYLIEHGASVMTHKSNGASVAWSVHLTILDQQPGSEMRRKFERLRDLMVQKGAKFPPDPPEVVRDQMRAQGLKPAVPPGQTK